MTNNRILIIDDSTHVQALIRARLAGTGLTVASTETTAAAVVFIEKTTPDLILLDADLPGATDLCRRLSMDPRTTGLPILLLTSATTAEERVRGLNAGALDYVSKPIDATELRVRVRAALRMRFMACLLADKARIDPLTGLWNRAHFERRLAECESLSRRSGAPLALLRLQLRWASPPEATFIDDALSMLAGITRRTTRTEDNLFRLAGNEIAILLPHTPHDGAAALAQRIVSRFAALPPAAPDGPRGATVSVGVAVFDASAAESMFDRATPVDPVSLAVCG